jgi:biopolymer transport protein ExbB
MAFRAGVKDDTEMTYPTRAARLIAGLVALSLCLPGSGAAQSTSQTPPVQPPAAAAPQTQPTPTQAVSPVPVKDTAPASTHETAALTLPRDLSPWGMFMAADIVVKAVMIGLAFASVLSWTIWFAKGIELMSARGRIDAPAGIAAMNSINVSDDLVGRLRGKVIARDLVFEKVDEKTAPPAASGAPAKEKAVYVVNPNTGADSRLVVDLSLRHR